MHLAGAHRGERPVEGVLLKAWPQRMLCAVLDLVPPDLFDARHEMRWDQLHALRRRQLMLGEVGADDEAVVAHVVRSDPALLTPAHPQARPKTGPGDNRRRGARRDQTL
jgi:hypothetical protein